MKRMWLAVEPHSKGQNATTYLLEFTLSHEAILAMLRSSGPSDRMVGVELDASTSFFFVNDLQSVVIDEHIRRPALQLICGNGLFDGFDGGSDDGMQTFLVNRALNSDMRKGSVCKTR